MRNALSLFLTKWWSPPISHLFLFALFLVALPILTLDLVNSRTLVIAETILGGLLVPVFLAILHRASLIAVAVLELLTAVAIFITWPTEQMGNWKMQVAGHLLGWSLVGFLCCGLIQSVILFWAKPRLEE